MADANVRVLISALTEAAQQSIEEVGDEMQNIQADGHLAAEGLDAASDEMSEATRTAAILQSALDEVGDEAVSAGVKAQFLQDALDEVGDQATQAAVQSQNTSGAFSSLSLSASGASLSVGTLSTAFTLSLIPAVLTAATVLAPLVVVLGALAAGAVALAGAFGLIIGSGILAWGDQMAQQNQEELDQTNRLIDQYETMKETQGSLTAQQQDRLRQLRQKKDELKDQTTATGALAGVIGDLKEELKPLIVDFGRGFIPLIREAVEAIPDVVEEMFAAVGGTDEFKEALREFGNLAADVLPALVGLMFDLARLALPVLEDLVNFLQDNGEGALQAMKESVMELEPELMDLLDALTDLAPDLLEFGTDVGEVLIPAITGFIETLDDLLESFQDLDPWVQELIIKVLLLAPAIIWLLGKLGGLKTLILGGKGLKFALKGLAKVLAGSGAVSSASVYGAAILAGAGIGVMGVRALEAVGALDELQQAGADLREELGGDTADKLLAGGNALTLGGLERISKLGGAARGVALPDETVQGNLGKVDTVFENAEITTQSDIQEEPAAAPAPRQPRDEVIERQINQTEVNVDVGGDLQSDPYSFSRSVADQVTREQRQNNGT